LSPHPSPFVPRENDESGAKNEGETGGPLTAVETFKKEVLLFGSGIVFSHNFSQLKNRHMKPVEKDED